MHPYFLLALSVAICADLFLLALFAIALLRLRSTIREHRADLLPDDFEDQHRELLRVAREDER
jgi:hypothetical protein